MTKRKNRAGKFEDTFILPAELEYCGFEVTCKFTAFWEEYEPDTGFGEQWHTECFKLWCDGLRSNPHVTPNHLTKDVHKIAFDSDWTQTNLEAILEAVHEHCESFYDEENQ